MSRNRNSPSWATVLILFALGVSAGPPPVLTRTTEVATALNPVLSDYEVIRLEPGDIEQQVRSTGELRFQFEENSFYFRLEPHDLRAPNYRAVETGLGGVTRELSPGPVRTFKGRLSGQEKTMGRFTVTAKGIEGIVFAPEERYYLEPLRNYLPTAEAAELVVYRHSDIKTGQAWKCGLSLPRRLQRGLRQVEAQIEANPPTNYVAEVGTEADFEYVQALGSSEAANAEIQGIMNQVEAVYQSELLLQLKISFQHFWTTEDPYHKTDKFALLHDFGAYWNTHFAASENYDLAHLWTGKSLSVYGTATRSVVCSLRASSYGLSVRRTSIPAKYALSAHEIGHNFGATHPHERNPPVPGCWGTIMHSSGSVAGRGSQLTFCEFSRQQIASFVARNNSCLTTRPITLRTPSDLTAASVSSSGIDLSWQDNSPNETGFRVERRPGEGNRWIQIGTAAGDQTTFSSRGLFPGDTYRYRVQAFNDSESSAFSNEAAATTLEGPLTRPYWKIDTIAGGGIGDNGPAVGALLASPSDVTADDSGNLYVADTYNHRIRRIDPSGTIATVAGTGSGGFSGDNGPALAARLSHPTAVAVDRAGNLFVADRSNHRIRRIDPSGTITTIAGTGERGFGGDRGPSVAAQLNLPIYVALDDAGNLYIVDEWNHRIRRVDPSGTITTIAGTGSRGFGGEGGPAVAAQLNHPNGLAVDGSGGLYVTDSGNHRLRHIDPSGTITTVAGTGERGFGGDGGPASQALLAHPAGTAIDSAGNLFFSDAGNHVIRRIAPSGVITTIAGSRERGFGGDTGPALAAQLNVPAGVAVGAAGTLLIADRLNHRIRRIDSSGTIATTAGIGKRVFGGDKGPALAAQLNSPRGVAVDGSGHIFIADTGNHRVHRVDAAGTLTTIAGTGEPGFNGGNGPAIAVQLNTPTDLAVDAAGNLYIADTGNHSIRQVDPSGTITTIAGTGEPGFNGDNGPAVAAQLSSPTSLAVDAGGDLYIADTENDRIRRVDPSGAITTIAGNGKQGFSGDGGPAMAAQLYSPGGVALDTTGNLYVADTWNQRIRRVDTSGTITTIVGIGERGYGGDNGPAPAARLDFPVDIVVDKSRNLYIADRFNHRIRRVDPSGTIATIAGEGGCCFSGDKGPAVQARLQSPEGVAVDGAGNLYIADTGNHRIRLVTRFSPPTSLDAPTRLTATALTSSRAHLSWRDNSDNETGFSVHRRQGGSREWVEAATLPTNATTFSDVGLISDTLYTYRVQAFNDSQSSTFSNQATVTLSSLHPPSKLEATSISTSRIDLSWQDNSTDEIGFRVQRQRAGSGDWVQAGAVAANQTTLSDMGLSAGILYRYRVQAFSNSQSSAFSDPAAATTVTLHPPSGLTANPVSSSRIDLSWRDNSNETGFKVERQHQGSAEWLSIGTTAADLTTFLDVGSLSPDTLYRYRVQAFNNRESSLYSDEAEAATPAGPSTPAEWIINTIAGGSVGDNRPAIAALLNYPSGLALDGSGNLFIADDSNHRIRRVDPSGTITTLAGTGERGFGGDGGPAIAARLHNPADLVLDGAGNLLIADRNNHRIRRMDPSGTITTIAGTGKNGFGGDGGPAVAAQLNDPSGLAIDGAGNLYFADSSNHRIRRIDPSGTIATVAGSGNIGFDQGGFSGDGGPAIAARLNNPTDLALDAAGILFIADTLNHRIRRVDSSGIITTLAGTEVSGFGGDGGPSVAAQLNFPSGLALDSVGNLFIADGSNERIRRIDPSGTITTVAGRGEPGLSGDGGSARAARLSGPSALLTDSSGNLFIADGFNHRIRRVDASGTITTIAGTGRGSFGGDSGPATDAQLHFPQGVTVDGTGNFFIADTENHRIRRVNSSGTITTIAGTGTAGIEGDSGPATDAQLHSPKGVAVDGTGNLFIADTENHRIRRVDPSGTISTVAGTGRGFSGDGGPATAAQLDSPEDVAVDGTGNLLIADTYNRRIRRIDPSGNISTIAGTGESRLSGDSGPAVAAAVGLPHRVSVDGVGSIYITAQFNDRIRRVDPSGTISTVAGTGESGFSGDGGPAIEAQLRRAGGVVVDSTGNVYIADAGNFRIRRIDAAGNITTIAGNGEWGVRGDGGPAAQARMSFPTGLAVDIGGSLYIADTENHRIRIVTRTSPFGTLQAPDELTATPVSTSRINLSWRDNGANETGFRLERRRDGSSDWVVIGTTPANTTGHSDQGLLPDTSYHYRVQAFNAGATSAFSNQAGATTKGFAPTVSGFSPKGGPVGTGVTVTGTHLLAATDVRFDEVGADEFEVLSTTRLRAVVPPQAASGPISVVTPNGTGVSAGNFTVTESGTHSRLFVPIVLRLGGQAGSFYTSELTLTNRGSQQAGIRYSYSASIGSGSGTAPDTLGAGEQRIIPDAVAHLASLGMPIGNGGAGGTLQVDFSGLASGSDGAVTVRTSTPVPEGRAGLAYPGLNALELLNGPAWLTGLRQNGVDRSNLALQNAGEEDVTLKVTVYSGDPATPGSLVIEDKTLEPGEFFQYNSILATVGFDQGYVRVERTGGTAPYYAYAVINDQTNSDGSFVFPVREDSLAGKTGQTLPVIVETAIFNSELAVTNFSGSAKTVDFQFVSDAVRTPDHTARFNLSLQAGEQRIIPDIVNGLRRQGVAGIGSKGPVIAGAVFAAVAGGDMSGIVIAARTGAPGGGGQYGVFYHGVPDGAASTGSAWIYGLQQNGENRSNLALVNTGEVDGSDSGFNIDIYDGSTGRLVRIVGDIRVPARHWHQVNRLLAQYAPGTGQGYVQVRRIEGNNPFIAYGVINDGGAPGQRSGDGAFLNSRP